MKKNKGKYSGLKRDVEYRQRKSDFLKSRLILLILFVLISSVIFFVLIMMSLFGFMIAVVLIFGIFAISIIVELVNGLKKLNKEYKAGAYMSIGLDMYKSSNKKK